MPEPLNYTPVLRTRYGRSRACEEAAALLAAAKRPVIYAGGHALREGLAAAQAARRTPAIRYDKPWRQIVVSETHPLSLGSGGLAVPRGAEISRQAGVIFGVAVPLTETSLASQCQRARPSSIRRSTVISTRMSRPKSAWSAMRTGARCAAEEIGG